MNHISDVTDERALCPVTHGWRAVGAVFLVVSLLGLSVGAFWGFFPPAHRFEIRTNPPALQVLISVQAVFLIMFWPLLVPRQSKFLSRGVAEYVIFLAVSVPLYVVAAYLSDATSTDVIRSACYLSAVAVGALGLGLWAQGGRAAIITAVTLAGVLIGLGGPVMYYLLVELTDSAGAVDWLWWASPAMCAFDVAVARGPDLYPTPFWAWALWPVVGVVLFFVHELKKKK